MAPPRPRQLSQDERARLITRVKELLQRRTEIQLAVLHGSFQTADSFRDVDLALHLVDGHRERFRDSELEQGVRWSEQLGMPIDVRLLNDAPVAFRYHALKGGLVRMRDEECYDELRAGTWDEYCDFAPFARRYWQDVVGG